jgi:hypothetical protein
MSEPLDIKIVRMMAASLNREGFTQLNMAALGGLLNQLCDEVDQAKADRATAERTKDVIGFHSCKQAVEVMDLRAQVSALIAERDALRERVQAWERQEKNLCRPCLAWLEGTGCLSTDSGSRLPEGEKP